MIGSPGILFHWCIHGRKCRVISVTYTTVSTVCPSPALGSLVDLDVLDNEVGGVKTLAVGVGFGVLEEVGEELGGLDGPASLGDLPLLACTKEGTNHQHSESTSLGRVIDPSLVRFNPGKKQVSDIPIQPCHSLNPQYLFSFLFSLSLLSFSLSFLISQNQTI